MKVVLPDDSELELPDGATGLDAARAIGPKLAEQAVLVRSNGHVQDLRAPLEDGQQIQILTTRDKDDPGRALRPAPLDRAPARRGRPPALPGREDRDRPADRERLLLRLRVPGADRRGRARADRGGDPEGARRGPRVEPRGGLARGGQALLRGAGRAVQGRARRHRRGPDLPLHAGRLHRPLPRPAPAGLEADQGAQADRPRRRVLARRREEHAADPDLRHRLLRARPTSTRTSSGSRRRASATTAGSARSSTSSTSPSSRPARRSGTRRGW